jgi:hypothetical protein
MNQNEVDARIAALQNRRPSDFGVAVEHGTEVERSLARGDGRVNVSVLSALSREAELAERNASRQFRDTGGAAQEIVMSATSSEPSDTNSVILGDLLVWHAASASFWDNHGRSVDPNAKVMIAGADGKRLELTGPGALPLFTELKRLADASKSKRK